MTKELGLYRQFKEESEGRVKELESMIQERDREINRLNGLYTGEETVSQTAFFEKENRDTINKLNAQLDYINKENNRLHKINSELKVKNKGNTGMYYENRKVVDRIDKLKKSKLSLRILS